MKNYYFFFLLALSLSALQCASSKKLQYEKLSSNLLWKISGNGLTQNSYLYGTIHMIGSDDYFLPNGTFSAIDECEKITFEIDMTEMNDLSKLMPILEKAYMDDGLTLKDLISKEDYQTVKDHFAEMGVPLFLMERIKPMFLTVFAGGDIKPGDFQSGKIKSYEFEFTKIAEEAGKSIAGLETIEYQISIFDSIPYQKQADMLLESISQVDSSAMDLQILENMYKTQNIEALYGAMKDEESIAEYADVLLVQRNKNWIPIMRSMMNDQQTFFAVGAGHLAGPDGVIHLLKMEGFQVTPVN